MSTISAPGAQGSPSSGATNSGILSDWAAPYVTQMLGQTQALAAQPYQVYQGPMTAGESGLQSTVFQGLGNLNFPSQLGNTFSSTGAYQLPNMNAPAGTAPTAPAGPTGVAANYMNPYLQSVLNPQLDELRRQNDITNMGTNAKFTQAGAYGGGRQAIMNAENNRNLMMEQNKTVGQGYANAYDKAMQQFNTEQGQAKGLAELIAQQGASQRGIEQEGITADLNEFNAQRDYPQKMLQFQQSMLQGLPVQSVQNTAGSLSGLGSLFAGLGGGAAVASNLGYKNVGELLKQFGLDLGPAAS